MTANKNSKFQLSVLCFATLVFALLLPKTAVAWGGPCIFEVEKDREVKGQHFTVVVVGDDTPGCDLYRVAKRYPQTDADGKVLSVHEQLLSLFAVNGGENRVGGKDSNEAVLRTCIPNAKPWEDATSSEAQFCSGYVNYIPNGNGGEILIPHNRVLTVAEKIEVTAKSACMRLDKNGLTSKDDSELVSGCRELDSGLVFAGALGAKAPPPVTSETKGANGEAYVALWKRFLKLQGEVAVAQTLAAHGKLLPYAGGLIVLLFLLSSALFLGYVARGKKLEELEAAEAAGSEPGERKSFVAHALQDSAELEKAKELCAAAETEAENSKNALEIADAELAEAKDSLAEAEARLAKLQADHDELKVAHTAQGEELRKNIEAGDKLVAENGKLNVELDAVRTERDAFANDLTGASADTERAENRASKLAKSELQLKLDVERLEGERNAAETALQETQTRLEIAERRVLELQAIAYSRVPSENSTVTDIGGLGVPAELTSTVTNNQDHDPVDETGTYACINPAPANGEDWTNEPEMSVEQLEAHLAAGGSLTAVCTPSPVSHFPLEVDPDKRSEFFGSAERLYQEMLARRKAEVGRLRQAARERTHGVRLIDRRLNRAEDALAGLRVLEDSDAEEKALGLVDLLLREQRQSPIDESKEMLVELASLAIMRLGEFEQGLETLYYVVAERVVELAGKESENERLVQATRELRGQIADLQNQLAESEQRRSELVGELAKADGKDPQLQAELKRAYAQVEEVNEAIASLVDEARQTYAEVADLHSRESRVAFLEMRVAELTKADLQFRNNRGRMLEDLASLESQVRGLRQERANEEQRHRDAERDLREKLETSERDRKDFEGLADLQAKKLEKLEARQTLGKDEQTAHGLVRRKLMEAPLEHVVKTTYTCVKALVARANNGEMPKLVFVSMEDVLTLHNLLNLQVGFSGELTGGSSANASVVTAPLFQLGMPGYERLIRGNGLPHCPTMPPPEKPSPVADAAGRQTLHGLVPAEDDEDSGPRVRTLDTKRPGKLPEASGST